MYNQKVDDLPSLDILNALIEDLSKDSILLSQLLLVRDFDPKTLSLVSNNNVWEAYKDCSRVGDVYLTAYDGVEEAQEKRMYIINCAEEFEGKLGADLEFNIEPYRYSTIDMLDRAVREIHERVQDGINVSLNCRMGMERSALVAAKYLEDIHGMTMDQAYDYIMLSRPIVLDRRSWIEGDLY